MNQPEIKQQEIETVKETRSNLTVGNGFNFGLGFGIGFFISGVIISIITGFIVFTLFASTITSFQKAITDPFGFKSSSQSLFK
ncbi:MAG: hypothetical protein WCN88_01215 [Candidatus Falkowbacteria bacterium]